MALKKFLKIWAATEMRKHLFILAGFVLVGFSVVFGFAASVGAMTISGALSIVLFFFAHLDQIVEIEWWGGKAKTREVVREAKDLLAEIRELSLVMGSSIITTITTSDRIGGVDFWQKEKHIKEVVDVLAKLGVPKDRIENLETPFRNQTKFDYVYYILGAAATPRHLSAELIEQWRELRSRSQPDYPSPDELLEFLDGCKLLTDERRERVEDYRHYLATFEIKRPDEWDRKNKWDLKPAPE